MSVTLILLQTRSVVNNQYRVSNEISSSSGISKKVFVKRESTHEYDRVATVDDMLNLPEIPDPNDGYFRDDSFYKDFVDVSRASNFSDGVKERIDLLVTGYNEVVNDFIGSDESQYTN